MKKFDEDIAYARICPYCGKKPQYVDSKIIYGRSYGMVYYCADCDAYVGVHHGNTKIPLGRLANRMLRDAKKEAHAWFDPLWKKAVDNGMRRHDARNKAYDWLSKELETPREFTHIGMFDISLCNRVVQICKPFYTKKTE